MPDESGDRPDSVKIDGKHNHGSEIVVDVISSESYPPFSSNITGVESTAHLLNTGFGGISSQFNMLVVISTFTTALIISFLSLVDQAVDAPDSLVHDIGIWLSFLSSGIHLWVAIVAGRAALLAFNHSDLESNHGPKITRRELHHYLVLCEQLQLVGTIIFAPAVLMLIPKMFNRMGFGISLYVIAISSIIFIFRAGFWKVSVLFGNLKCLWKWIRGE